jgi:DNA-binding NtrC family response regulator
VDLRVPALRERQADILELAEYFLERHRSTRRVRLSAAAADALIAYEWPGNVRELERLIEHVVALSESDVIELDNLPPIVRGEYAARLLPSVERNETMREWAARYARLMLQRCGGNKREASRLLGISYHTLGSYLRRPIDGVVASGPWGSQPEATGDAPDPICAVEG